MLSTFPLLSNMSMCGALLMVGYQTAGIWMVSYGSSHRCMVTNLQTTSLIGDINRKALAMIATCKMRMGHRWLKKSNVKVWRCVYCGANRMRNPNPVTKKAKKRKVARATKMSFSATIKTCRLELGLSQREMAKVMGMSNSHLSRFEKGGGPVLHEVSIRRLSIYIAKTSGGSAIAISHHFLKMAATAKCMRDGFVKLSVKGEGKDLATELVLNWPLTEVKRIAIQAILEMD